MRHLKPYSKYKPSGVEWLGNVPEHWEYRKLSLITEVLSGFPFDASLFGYEGIAVIRMSDFAGGKIDAERAKKIVPKNVPPKALAKKGDILLGLSGSISNYALIESSDLPVAINQRVGIVRCNGDIQRFLYWFLQSECFLEQMTSQLPETTIQNISMELIKACKVTNPSKSEQSAIADFLDRETGRIDALVEKKRRFIVLLKEKRQALITAAVTGQFDVRTGKPYPAYKPSGVEWLGDVPTHWEVKRLKHFVAIPITDGPHETPEFVDDGIPFVSAEAIASGVIDFNKVRGFISDKENKRYSLKYFPRKYDIYMVKSGATTGVTAIVETDRNFNIWSPLAVIRCNQKTDPYFVLNCLRSRSFQDAVELNWSYGTQQNIGMGVLGNLSIPYPSLNEQTAIAAFLDRETGRIDALIEKTERSIELLKEKRAALITAAVTGKIDVREAANQ